MHKNFVDWYNAVSLKPDAQTLKLRWEAVEKIASQLKIPEVPNLVRAFYAMGGADEFFEQIRKAAKEKDTTFVTDGDRNELTVLAGSVIAQSVSDSSTVADAVALAVACAGAQGLRPSPRLQGVVDESMRYLAEESVRVRTISKDPVSDVNVAALLKLVASKGGVAVSDVNSVWSGVDAVFKELFTQHTKHTQSINLALDSALRLHKEESEILWWLFSEHTLDGTKALSDLTIPEACFWGARDLATLTYFLPGPFAAPAFLHKMIRLVEDKVPPKVKISEAVDACDLEWKHKWLQTVTVQHLPEFCPMLFAIAKSVEVGGGTEWTPAFEHATGLTAGGKLAPVHLALQIYSEELLLRALAVKG